MGNVRSIIWHVAWIVVKRSIGALACPYKGKKKYRGSAERRLKTTSFATAKSGKKGRTIIVVYSC